MQHMAQALLTAQHQLASVAAGQQGINGTQVEGTQQRSQSRLIILEGKWIIVTVIRYASRRWCNLSTSERLTRGSENLLGIL